MGREITVLVVTICLWLPVSGAALASGYKKAEDVFVGGKTVVSEPIDYPRGKAKVHALIVTLMPGKESGWHRHGVPLFGYILKGEVTVNYGPHGTQTYRQGSGFMETISTAHNSRNTGAKPCRILAVFIGSEELIFTQRVPVPKRIQ